MSGIKIKKLRANDFIITAGEIRGFETQLTLKTSGVSVQFATGR